MGFKVFSSILSKFTAIEHATCSFSLKYPPHSSPHLWQIPPSPSNLSLDVTFLTLSHATSLRHPVAFLTTPKIMPLLHCSAIAGLSILLTGL